jgi:hypothetical protein
VDESVTSLVVEHPVKVAEQRGESGHVSIADRMARFPAMAAGPSIKQENEQAIKNRQSSRHFRTDDWHWDLSEADGMATAGKNLGKSTKETVEKGLDEIFLLISLNGFSEWRCQSENTANEEPGNQCQQHRKRLVTWDLGDTITIKRFISGDGCGSDDTDHCQR